MPIAATLRDYLERLSVDYQTHTHSYTPSSARTAEVAHIPGDRVVKAVVLKRSDDSFLLMVVPSDYRVHLGRLHRLLDDELGLATEAELKDLFPDCFEGAIPPFGAAYGLRTLVDRHLFEQPEVYIESGDHQTLIRLSQDQFSRLLQDAETVEAARHA